MEINIINKSFFTYAKKKLNRLDPEFALKSLVYEEEALKKYPGQKLNMLINKYNGPTINDSYADEETIINYVAIESVDTEDGLSYSQTLQFKDRPSRAHYELQSEDILVSNVRPNRGAITFITERHKGNLASSGFTLLRSNPSVGISQEFIFAFLKSSCGKKQLVRRNRGSMYPAVVEDDVLDVWLPTPPFEIIQKVTNLVSSGFVFHDRFFYLLNEQNNMLNDFLKPYGAPPSPLEPSNGSISNIISKKDIYSSDGAVRFDADFFRKEYLDFDLKCKKTGLSFLLEDYYDLFTGKSLGNPNTLIPYIKQSILTNAGINWSAVSYEMGDPGTMTGRIKDGDILLACTAHEIYYVGRKVDFVREVPKDIQETNYCVSDLIVIRPNDNKPKHLYGSYIAAFLRNESGLHQVQRCIRGLRGGHVYPRDIKRYVRIPFPNKQWLDRFEEVSRIAEEKRNEGKNAITEAVKLIDSWIANLLINN